MPREAGHEPPQLPADIHRLPLVLPGISPGPVNRLFSLDILALVGAPVHVGYPAMYVSGNLPVICGVVSKFRSR